MDEKALGSSPERGNVEPDARSGRPSPVNGDPRAEPRPGAPVDHGTGPPRGTIGRNGLNLAALVATGFVAWVIARETFKGGSEPKAVPASPASKGGADEPKSESWTSVLRRLGTFLDAARRGVLNAAAIVATGFVAWVIAHDVVTGDYEVMTIEVPSNLAQRLSGEAVSSAIRDGVAENWRKASNSSPISVIEHDKEEPDITIGGSNVSLRYVAKLLRREIHRPVVEISGRLVEVRPTPRDAAPAVGASGEDATSTRGGEGWPLVRLTLSDSVGSQNPFFDEEGRYDEVLRDASLASLQEIDPFAAVLAGSQGTQDQRLEALRVAKTILASKKATPELGKALLAEATAFVGLRRWDQAKDYLGRAVQALGGPSGDRGLLPVAQDGLAIVFMIKHDWPQARDAVTESLRLKSDYDSAQYHKVEIDDEISREYFGVGPDGKRDACQAEKIYWAAVKGYADFYDLHPRFSVAYTMYATMRLIRLHWMRTGHRVTGCPDTPHVEALDMNEKDTREAFEQAITEDAKDYTAWFQRANLLFELQDPQYADSEKDPDKRQHLLDDAEASYRKSLALETGDYYVWYRYAETLSLDVTFRPGLAGGNKPLAIAAYCKSVALNRLDSGLALDARHKVGALSGTCPG